MAPSNLPQKNQDDLGDDPVFSDINITPLTDIFLVLLVIFMVTSSVIVNSGGGGQAGLKVNLPQGGTAADVQPSPSDLPIAVLSDGRIMLSGNVVSLDELKTELETAKKKQPNTLVLVQADEGVAHGKVVEVMELAKAAGLSQLAIGVRDDKK